MKKLLFALLMTFFTSSVHAYTVKLGDCIGDFDEGSVLWLDLEGATCSKTNELELTIRLQKAGSEQKRVIYNGVISQRYSKVSKSITLRDRKGSLEMIIEPEKVGPGRYTVPGSIYFETSKGKVYKGEFSDGCILLIK